MAKYVAKTQGELTKLLEKQAMIALKAVQDIIYKCIHESIQQYYSEYDPIRYNRSYRLLNSLVSTDIVKSGNMLSCEVKIDENYLNYTYVGNPNEPRIPHYNPATGLDVVMWANQKQHGGLSNDSFNIEFWDDAIDGSLGGDEGIISLLKKNLIKAGLKLV